MPDLLVPDYSVFQGQMPDSSFSAFQATPRFNPGTVSSGSATLGQLLASTSQSELDLWALALSLDGWFIRKDPGAGAKGDKYDFGATPGTDLSGSIRFEEDVNVEDIEVTSASELYSTDLRMNATPGGSSGGNIVWPKIGTQGDMVLTDTVTDVGIPEFTLLARAAQALQAIKVSPWSAKTVKVVRDTKTADKWRELDYVTLHVPSLDISNLKALVLGYTFTEGALSQDVYLDQYPESVSMIPVQRLQRTIENLGNTYKQR